MTTYDNTAQDSYANFDLQKLNAHRQRIIRFWPELTSKAASQFPEFANLYSTIKSKNVPNFLGARISLKSGLKLATWEEKLCLYHDREIC